MAALRNGRLEPDVTPDDHGAWALLAAPDGGLWIGSWGQGLSYFKDGRTIAYTTDNSGLAGSVVLALYRDVEGALWIGTGHGLNRFADGQWRTYRTRDGLVNDDVRFIT